MNRTAARWLEKSLIIAAAAFATACSDRSPVAPALTTAAVARNDDRTPDLGTCGKLNVDEPATLTFRAYAQGVQIYRWNGASWSFVAPSATLYTDENENGQVATHYVGPTWESNSGSKVVGAVLERCTPDANSIPWLKLSAVSSEGPGVFYGVTFIQRLNTVGGNAPLTPGTVVGDTANVPYTAEYYFYRAK